MAVAILAALPLEFEAVLGVGGPWKSEPPPSGLLHLATWQSDNLDVFAGCAAAAGQVDAAIATANLLATSNAHLLLVTGICASISRDVQIGDICISEQIVDYGLTRVQQGREVVRWAAFRTPSTLVSDLRRYATQARAARSGSRSEIGLPPLTRSVHCGTVLSGNKVVADSGYVEELRSYWSHALAIEMEAAGAARTVDRLGGPPVVMVKAASDLADESKSDEFQIPCAQQAARFAIGYLDSRRRHLSEPVARAALLGERLPMRSEGAQDDLGRPSGYQLGDTESLALVFGASFSIGELQELTAEVDEDWLAMPGKTKHDKARNMIELFRSRNKGDVLHAYVRRQRPDLWASRSGSSHSASEQ